MHIGWWASELVVQSENADTHMFSWHVSYPSPVLHSPARTSRPQPSLYFPHCLTRGVQIKSGT